MLEFIHDQFKLDLTHVRPTYTLENSWFKNELESDYTFPFQIPYLDWVKIFDSIHFNSLSRQLSFKGVLNTDGVISDATLRIQDAQGKKINATIISGFEGISTFDKKLSELSLQRLEDVNMKSHALSVLGKGYPEVNYNFPSVYTDKYDPKSDEYLGFLGLLNNYKNGSFVENQLQVDTNLDEIKNIMQPLPYLLHVLEKGFEDAGYTLQGDVLSLPEFKDALIYCNNNYYNSPSKEPILFQIPFRDYQSVVSRVQIDEGLWCDVVKYSFSQRIEKKGDYILFGYIQWFIYMKHLISRMTLTPLDVRITLVRHGQELELFHDHIDILPGAWDFSGPPRILTNEVSLDQEVSLEIGDVIRFDKIEASREFNPEELENYPYAADFKLIPVRYKHPNGDPIISIQDKDQIDLTLCVPDMTFKALVEQILKLKKLDMYVLGKNVYMNKVSRQIQQRDQAFDFSEFDVLDPVMTFNDARSYELKFADGDKNEDYPYQSLYITQDEVLQAPYSLSKDATQINIDALAYPEKSYQGYRSAFAFDEEKSKLRIVSYKSMGYAGSDGNASYQNSKLLIPYVYEVDYKAFLDFCLKSVTYQWDNIISVERMREITAQSILYAYSNYHVLVDLEKERVGELWWKVSFKTESL